MKLTTRTTLHADVLIKRQSPELARLEWLKTERAAVIGRDTGLFRTSCVNDYDAETGVITFERLHGARRLREVLQDPSLQRPLLERVARALAAIHERLRLPDECAHSIAEPAAARVGADVWVHGDFTIENLLFLPDPDEIVIVDWLAAAWLGESVTRGPRYLDVGTFLLSTTFHNVLRGTSIGSVDSVAAAFSSAYVDAVPAASVGELRRYFAVLLPFYQRFQRRRLGWRSLFYAPSLRPLVAAIRALS